MDIATLTAWGSLIGVASGVLGALAYKIIRIVKEDRGNDGLHKNAIDLIAHYKDLSERVQARLEIVEQERNHFATEVGRLSATVEYMTERITGLEALCKKLEGENQKLLDHSEAQSLVLEQVLEELRRRSVNA